MTGNSTHPTLFQCFRQLHFTGKEKYREAALRNGGWWLALDRFPETHASVPAALNYFLDLYRLTGDRRFLEKSGPYIEKVLESQCLNPENRAAHGGFRGHDLAGEREKKIHTAGAMDYVSHRTTMYAMMALAKIAARSEKEWNMAYSAFGW